MLLATTSYTVCIVGVILMYIWYAPDSSCLLNIFFITWTLFLIQLMTSIALHPKVSLWMFSSHVCFGCLKLLRFVCAFANIIRWMPDTWLQLLWDSMLCLYAGVPFEGMFMFPSILISVFSMSLTDNPVRLDLKNPNHLTRLNQINPELTHKPIVWLTGPVSWSYLKFSFGLKVWKSNKTKSLFHLFHCFS